MLLEITSPTSQRENFYQLGLWWSPPPSNLVLRHNEVHVWRADLEAEAARVQNLRAMLSPDEVARADCFRFQPDQERFIIARGLLRVILGRYLELEPGQLHFSYSSYGKPALTNGVGQEIFNFNMSHSHQLALYAVTRGRKIGVDLENIRTDFACEEIAERFFAPAEKTRLRAIVPEMKHEAFFNGWTRKEAYIKARGQGLAFPLHQFEVSLTPGEPAALLDVAGDFFETSRWTLRELEPGPDYAAALAVEGRDWQLKCWQWRE